MQQVNSFSRVFFLSLRNFLQANSKKKGGPKKKIAEIMARDSRNEHSRKIPQESTITIVISSSGVKGKKKRLLLCSLLLNIWKIETKCKLIFFFLGWLKVRFFMKVWDFGRVKDDKRDKMEDPFTRSRWVFSSIVVLVWGSAGTPLASFSWKFKESKKIKGTTGHYHHYHSNQQ